MSTHVDLGDINDVIGEINALEEVVKSIGTAAGKDKGKRALNMIF